MLTMDLIANARRVLFGVAEQTAMIPATDLCRQSEVFLKMENLQKTGSFKLRGAYYRISQMPEEEKRKGVIACSAGNHAQGVALAAAREGIPCVICMPEGASISKAQKTRSYGAEVVFCPGVFDDAYAKAKMLQAEKGYAFVHPFDDLDVIAGQGTIGLEILEQVPDVDVIFVPVGGGGLLAGIAFAIKHIRPGCRVYGVEAAGAASMKSSLEAGAVETLASVVTIADGIAVKRPGDETFALCQQYADGIVTVSENEIASAILTLLEDYKVVAEGAGAAAVAAAMYGKVDIRGCKAVCLVSGGNVDVNLISRIISKGLKKTGRVMEFSTVLDDKPRQLSALLDVVSHAGANILSVRHDRDDTNVDVGKCVIDLSLETKGREHAAEIIEILTQKGYSILTQH